MARTHYCFTAWPGPIIVSLRGQDPLLFHCVASASSRLCFTHCAGFIKSDCVASASFIPCLTHCAGFIKSDCVASASFIPCLTHCAGFIKSDCVASASFVPCLTHCAGFIRTQTVWPVPVSYPVWRIVRVLSGPRLCGQCQFHTLFDALCRFYQDPDCVASASFIPCLTHCAGFIRTQTLWPGAMTVSLCGPAPASCRISALSTLHTSSTHTESRMYRKITINIMIHPEDMTFVEFIYLLSTLIIKADH